MLHFSPKIINYKHLAAKHLGPMNRWSCLRLVINNKAWLITISLLSKSLL